MVAKLYQLNQEKVEVWRAWCNEIASKRRVEAMETLLEEGGTFEVFILFCLENNWYTMGMGDTIGLGDDAREINQQHKNKKQECFTSSLPVEIGYILKA